MGVNNKLTCAATPNLITLLAPLKYFEYLIRNGKVR